MNQFSYISSVIHGSISLWYDNLFIYTSYVAVVDIRLFVRKIKSLIILTLCNLLYMCKITIYLQDLFNRDKFTGLPLHAVSQKIKNVLQFIYIEQYKVYTHVL